MQKQLEATRQGTQQGLVDKTQRSFKQTENRGRVHEGVLTLSVVPV